MSQSSTNTSKDYIISTVSALVYAVAIQITQNLNFNITETDLQINIAIFVPAIAAIIFGKTVGATSAGGGQILSLLGDNLFSAGATDLTTVSNLILLLSNVIGGWTVGALRQKNEDLTFDSFIGKFGSKNTWKRMLNNTFGAIVGLGLAGSFVNGFSDIILGNIAFVAGLKIFLQQFILYSLILLITIPITLFFFECGDLIINLRMLRLDKLLRRVDYTIAKEKVAIITKIDLPDRSMTKDDWTALRVRFRNILPEPAKFKIEAISTARLFPQRDATGLVQPSEIWEQTFFVYPAEQSKVNVRIRITEQLPRTFTGKIKQDETIVEITGTSYNPKQNAFTMIIFSASNLLTAGVSILGDKLLSVIDIIRDLNFAELVVRAQEHISFIGIITGIELFALGVAIWWIRRKILLTKEDIEAKISFGAEITKSRISQTKERLKKIVLKFQERLNDYLRIGLIFITVISVFILGFEGVSILRNPDDYSTDYGQELMIVAIIIFASWFIGLKGVDILRELGVLEKEKYQIQNTGSITSFKPSKDIIKSEPTEVKLIAVNKTNAPGLRIQLTGLDTISPDLVELSIPPKSRRTFRIALTPADVGDREILAITYPLFDTDNNYIPIDEAEPLHYQHLIYPVTAASQFLGINQKQKDQLKKVGQVVAGGILAILLSSQLVQTIFGGTDDLLNIIRDSAPIIAAIQVPIVYTYTYYQNKFKNKLYDVKTLLQEASAFDSITNRFDKVISSKIAKDFKSRINTDLNKKIAAQLDQYFGSSKKDDVDIDKDTIAHIIHQEIDHMVTDKVNSEISGTLDAKVKEIVSESMINQYSGRALKLLTQQRDLALLDDGKVSEDEYAQMDQLVKTELQSIIQDDLEQENKRNKLVKKFLRKIDKDIQKTIPKNITASVIDTTTARIQEEFDNRINSGLADDIFKELEKTLEDELSSQTATELEQNFSDRRFTQRIAEELDEKYGTEFYAGLEDTLGTKMEKKTISAIQDKFQEKLMVELGEKTKNRLLKKIKRKIRRYLKRKGKKILKKDLTHKLEEEIRTKISSSSDDKIIELIESSIDNSLGDIITQITEMTYVELGIKNLEEPSVSEENGFLTEEEDTL